MKPFSFLVIYSKYTGSSTGGTPIAKSQQHTFLETNIIVSTFSRSNRKSDRHTDLHYSKPRSEAPSCTP